MRSFFNLDFAAPEIQAKPTQHSKIAEKWPCSGDSTRKAREASDSAGHFQRVIARCGEWTKMTRENPWGPGIRAPRDRDPRAERWGRISSGREVRKAAECPLEQAFPSPLPKACRRFFGPCNGGTIRLEPRKRFHRFLFRE